MSHKHVLTVLGRYENVKQICQFVVNGAVQAGLDETAIFHVQLACDEACTNIIEHAYGGEDVGEIMVSWQLDKKHFTVTLHDNGRAFNPDNIPPPPILSDPASAFDIDDLREGGLGIYFIRKLMDEVRFTFDKEQGNTLVLVKYLTHE